MPVAAYRRQGTFHPGLLSPTAVAFTLAYLQGQGPPRSLPSHTGLSLSPSSCGLGVSLMRETSPPTLLFSSHLRWKVPWASTGQPHLSMAEEVEDLCSEWGPGWKTGPVVPSLICHLWPTWVTVWGGDGHAELCG